MSHFNILAGLGNPGRQYEDTRHNIGFRVADRLHEECEKLDKATSWKEKLGSLVSSITLDGEGGGRELLLAKPQGFMNRSGMPVSELVRFYKFPVESLIVVHDEIDLPLGTIRIKKGGGDGGHNGLKSVSTSLGSNDFVRVRVGVGRPSEAEIAAKVSGEDVSGWVLSKFKSEEMEIVKAQIDRAIEAVKVLCGSGIKIAQNRFN